MTGGLADPAARIAAVVDHLSEQLAVPPPPAEGQEGWRHQSLSRGAAGVAVLLGARAQAGLGSTGRVHAWLSLAVRDGISAGTGSGLWFGAPAVAFAMAVSAPGHYPSATWALKQAVAGMAQARLQAAHDRIAAAARPPLSEFDLVRGLTGIGAYLLHCEPGPQLLRQVLQYLVRLTEPVPAGDAAGTGAPGWWTGDSPGVQTAVDGGHANLGMAHGRAVISCVKSLTQAGAVSRVKGREARLS